MTTQSLQTPTSILKYVPLPTRSTPPALACIKEEDKLFFDFGATQHLCPLDYASEYPLDTSPTELRAVTGQTLRVHGTRTVNYRVGTTPIQVTYTVADITMPVLSA